MRKVFGRFVFFVLMMFMVCGIACAAEGAASAQRPNIVLILSDDVGFEECGVYGVKKGEPSNTPRIDALAERGVAFQTAWTQAICGPSRAMLYTGNYAPVNGAYDNKISYHPDGRKNLPYFTRVLHDAGYVTAVAGKWHNPNPGVLGLHNDLLGVDRYCVWYGDSTRIKAITGQERFPDDTSEIGPLSGKHLLSRYWKPTLIRDGRLLETTMQDYGPDMLTDYICEFIKKEAKTEAPFIAFYSMVLAHSAHCVTPIEVAAGMAPSNKHYQKHKPEGTKIFKNQVAYLDRLVGRVVDTVEAAGAADNTIIIYASDNGTTSSSKGRGVEYGVHVPFVVAGPGIKQRGLAPVLMDFTDVLPTLADFAGADIPANQPVAGVSLKPFLTGTSEKTKDVIYAFPGISSLVRTRDYLLEAVCPPYGKPRGRFYRTHGSYDGRGYENVTHDPEHAAMRKTFDALLARNPSPLPESFDDPIWQTTLERGFKHFDSAQQRKNHLSLPNDYKFYDPSF
jgi:arylsulfatase A